MEDAVDAINHCQVHRLVLKPWRSEDLLQTLRTIARGLLLERSHEQLLDELRRLNLELEQRVHTRTLELEQALLKLEQKNQLLEKMAATDPLTGLPNRRAIDRIARTELQRRTRLPAPIALLMIDADHFGRINKTYSQTTGDHVLIWLAGLFQASIRASDSVGRVGGEEFLVVAPGTDASGADVLAERLRVAVADPLTPASYENLREIAAEALKEAKETGRNKTVIRIVPPPLA
jgi:GGDEF domain-containing protein